jgi:hypothetical protein
VGWGQEADPAREIPLPGYLSTRVNVRVKLLRFWKYNENHDGEDDTLGSE